MRVSEELKYNVDMASLYELLAHYYEHQDPQAHAYYYLKHYQFAAKAAELARREDPPPSSSPEARVDGAGSDMTETAAPAVAPLGPAFSPHADHTVYDAIDSKPAAVSPGLMQMPPMLYPMQGAAPNIGAFPYGGFKREAAKVRAIHAIPDAPAVDVYVNGFKMLNGITYKAATNFITVPSGTYRLDVFPSGASGTAALLSETVTIEPGLAYTLAAAGTADHPAFIPFHEELNVPPGSVRLRFLHLSPDAGTIDIAPKGGNVLFPNVNFREATRYATIAPGTYNLEVRSAGTINVLLAVPNARMRGGNVYNVLVLGFAAGGTPAPLEAIVLQD